MKIQQLWMMQHVHYSYFISDGVLIQWVGSVQKFGYKSSACSLFHTAMYDTECSPGRKTIIKY